MTKRGVIEIENMEFYAFHGHFKEEQVVGNKFLVTVSIVTDVGTAAKSDNLDDALDYQKVYKIIKEQMEIKSFLIENIAGRILDALYKELGDKIYHIKLKISKINPPLGGKIDKVTIVVEQ
jgi:dihydroneopterin aldolase